jgi:hypothetical protein
MLSVLKYNFNAMTNHVSSFEDVNQSKQLTGLTASERASVKGNQFDMNSPPIMMRSEGGKKTKKYKRSKKSKRKFKLSKKYKRSKKSKKKSKLAKKITPRNEKNTNNIKNQDFETNNLLNP